MYLILDGDFPVAPSVNKSLRPGKTDGGKKHRLVHTKTFKSWYSSIGYLVNGQKIHSDFPTDSEPRRYRIEIDVNVDYKRDIDNIIKPTLDLLKQCHVISDDRYVDYLRCERVSVGPKNIMHVQVWWTKS